MQGARAQQQRGLQAAACLTGAAAEAHRRAERAAGRDGACAVGASVSELEAQKSKAELIKDKEALRDALQVNKHQSL